MWYFTYEFMLAKFMYLNNFIKLEIKMIDIINIFAFYADDSGGLKLKILLHII